MVLGVSDGEQNGDGLFDLVDPQHVVLVESAPGVEEEVGIGRRGHRPAVVGLERLGDVFGVIAEVEDEGVRPSGDGCG